MKHLFVPRYLASNLKEVGFDEYCFGFFNGEDITYTTDMCRNTFLTWREGTMKGMVFTPEPADADTNPDYERLKWGMKITAPMWQQVVDWFKDKHSMFIDVYPMELNKWGFSIEDISIKGFTRQNGELRKSARPFYTPSCYGAVLFDSHNLALTKAIEESIVIISKEKKEI